MPFLLTSPISKTDPMNEKRLSVWCVIVSAPSAPTTATGTLNITTNGVRYPLYSATISKYTSRTESASEMLMPMTVSFTNS